MKAIAWGIFMTTIAYAFPTHDVSTSSVFVGDTVTYTITYSGTIPDAIGLPTGLEQVSQTTHKGPTANQIETVYRIFSIDPITIPTRSVITADGPVTLPAITLTVEARVPTQNNWHDIEPLAPLWHMGMWPIIGLIGGLLAMGAFWAYRRPAKRMVVVAPQPDPLVVAQSALDALRQSITDDPVALKAIYFQLTAIMTVYITEKTGLNVVDATTREMIRLVNRHPAITRRDATTLARLANEIDYYKFSESPEFVRATCQKTVDAVSELIQAIAGDPAS
jgi:hypothetical protein